MSMLSSFGRDLGALVAPAAMILMFPNRLAQVILHRGDEKQGLVKRSCAHCSSLSDRFATALYIVSASLACVPAASQGWHERQARDSMSLLLHAAIQKYSRHSCAGWSYVVL